MIYAFSGKKLSGKSTAARYMAEKTEARRINFKDALIKETTLHFPTLIEAIIKNIEKHGWQGKDWTIERLIEEKPPLFRALLQNYGTEVRRGDDADYWVRKWKLEAGMFSLVVCDDVRFINEAQAVRDLGGMVIKIVRTDQTSNDSHISETEMDQIEPDMTISVETGDFDSLYLQLDTLLQADSTPKELRTYGE